MPKSKPSDRPLVTAKRAPPVAPRFFGLTWDPMEWSITDRCMFVAALMLPFAAAYWGIGAFLLHDPSRAPYYDFAFLRAFQTALLVFVGLWLAVIAAGLWLRRRAPRSRVLLHVTIQVYSIGNAIGAFCMGPVTTPYVLVLLGGAAVALFLFETRAVVMGITSAALTLLAGSIGVRAGLVPYAPLLAAPPYVGASVSGWWLAQMALVAVSVGSALLLLFAYLVARLRDREARLVRLSQTDALTGVANRRHFIEVFEREFERAQRYGTPLSAVILDLDHFKQINDRHGHMIGDRAIVAAAEAFERGLRAHDSLARWGGEEFVMLLPQTDLAGAEAVAERCRRSLEELVIDASGTPLRITVSIGVACHPQPAVTRSEDLLKRADDALYRAKHGGRNRVSSLPASSEVDGLR